MLLKKNQNIYKYIYKFIRIYQPVKSISRMILKNQFVNKEEIKKMQSIFVLLSWNNQYL